MPVVIKGHEQECRTANIENKQIIGLVKMLSGHLGNNAFFSDDIIYLAPLEVYYANPIL